MNSFPDPDAPTQRAFSQLQNEISAKIAKGRERDLRFARRYETLLIRTVTPLRGPSFYDVVGVSGRKDSPKCQLISMSTFIHHDEAEDFIAQAKALRLASRARAA